MGWEVPGMGMEEPLSQLPGPRDPSRVPHSPPWFRHSLHLPATLAPHGFPIPSGFQQFPVAPPIPYIPYPWILMPSLLPPSLFCSMIRDPPYKSWDAPIPERMTPPFQGGKGQPQPLHPNFQTQEGSEGPQNSLCTHIPRSG